MSNEVLGFIFGFMLGAIVLWLTFGGSLAFVIGFCFGVGILWSLFKVKEQNRKDDNE